jgi:hypothetical protein
MKTMAEYTVGIPVVRGRSGEIVWKPDSICCYCWSVDGDTVQARNKKGMILEAYRLGDGEFVTTMAKLGE